MQWKSTQNGHGEQLECDGFTISYIDYDVRILPDSDGGETALIDERSAKRGNCLILNGDFRKEYEKIADQGYDACKAFYDSQKAEHRCRWSEDGDADVTAEEAGIILSKALGGMFS